MIFFGLNTDTLKTLREFGVDLEWLKNFEDEVKKRASEKYLKLISSGIVKEIVKKGLSHFLYGDSFKEFIKVGIERWLEEYGT